MLANIHKHLTTIYTFLVYAINIKSPFPSSQL